MMTSDQLIERAKRGDRNAFQTIVDTFRGELFRLACGIMGNHHDAEDILQDAFIKAYRSLPNFRGDAALGSWLYRITVNCCMDHKRRIKAPVISLTNTSDDQSETDPQSTAPQSNPERINQSGNIRKAIHRGLDKLSPLERTVFSMRHYHELALKEIAESLDRKEGTIKNILFRAVHKMRDHLKHEQITLEEV